MGVPVTRHGGARLETICRYPVKGMTGQPMTDTVLIAGRGLPMDRLLGLSGGVIPAEADRNGWISSEALLRLRKNAELSRYQLAVEGEVLWLTAPDGRRLRLGLDADGLAASSERIGDWFPPGPLGPVRFERPGAALWDWPDAPLSIINLDTLRAMAEAADVPVDPRRFRANLYVSGLGAWRELDLPGHRVRLGGAELEITFPTERCRATMVRPGSGKRDLNIPALLASRFGHLYCGVYARVVRGGPIAVGDRFTDGGRGPGPDGPSRYAARLADPGRPRYAELIRRTEESPTVTTFAFRDPAGSHCRPGQHLRLHLTDDDNAPLWRCYTITGTDTAELRISVKRVPDGRMSPRLHDLPTGSRVLLSGPYGEALTAPDPHRPLLLAVAGIGITPVLPVLRDLLDTASRRPVTVLNVVRTGAELPLWDETVELLSKLPYGKPQLYVTNPGERLPHGARAGRPTAAELHTLSVAGTVEAHVCGPEGFVDTVRTALLSAGVPGDSITDERFHSPRPARLVEQPPPAAGPFTVRYTASGTRTTWTPDTGTLLDAAESAGLRLPSACRAGACGACRQLVTGPVAHLSEPAVPLAASQALLCCAVPVGDVQVHA
ncbi:MOSC domain-containing protein [Streptomyces geranii]|uniref:MOSC domain-containing protein n=1 Tax=Streptomyces geranii TaxID=2058923 RepID=UPI0013001742|nr:MOSC domain-containing protein [Streptomyces geranii]